MNQIFLLIPKFIMFQYQCYDIETTKKKYILENSFLSIRIIDTKKQRQRKKFSPELHQTVS